MKSNNKSHPLSLIDIVLSLAITSILVGFLFQQVV